MRRLRRFLRDPTLFAALLFVALLVANLAQNPRLLWPGPLAGAAAVAVPLMLGAFAVTPSVLAGGGGIDLSVGPLIGLINVLVVTVLVPLQLGEWWIAIPLLLLVGLGVGAVNGWLVAVARLQPIVATLGTFLILSGIALWLLPTPLGPVPEWFGRLSRHWHGVPLPLIFLAGPILVWLFFFLTPFTRTLLAVGGDDRAAYSCGVNVTAVRIVAYATGGLFAAFGGIALTALIQSADATVGPPMTLQAITAAALGGISLAGGRGSLWGSAFGALSLFLLQNLLTNQGVSVFWQQAVFGALLIAALILNALLLRAARRQAGAA